MIEWLGSVRGPVPEDRPQPTWGVMTLGLGTIIINQYLVEHVCEMLRAWRQSFFPRGKCFGVQSPKLAKGKKTSFYTHENALLAGRQPVLGGIKGNLQTPINPKQYPLIYIKEKQSPFAQGRKFVPLRWTKCPVAKTPRQMVRKMLVLYGK